IRFQRSLEVVVDDRGQRSRLRALALPRFLSERALPQPLHMLSSLVGFAALSWTDRLKLTQLGRALKAASDFDTVEHFLDALGQSESARRALWRPLAIATLNDAPETASAKMLAAVLREALMGSADDARLGFADGGLSDLYAEGARRFIEA